MPGIMKLKVPGSQITFEVPYFYELLAGPQNEAGRLPQDEGAHALWYYYMLASKNLAEAKENLVYEDERSKKFDVPMARRLLENISLMYGLKPAEVVRYWEAVEAQRVALGFSENADLPAVLKFRFN